VQDNKIALAKDPGRIDNLRNLPTVERERRLYGNWKIEDITGDGLFKPEWWKRLDLATWNEIKAKPDAFAWARGWDPAGGEGDTADYTAGGLVGVERDGPRIIIGDIARGRWSPKVRQDRMQAVLEADAAFNARTYFWKSRTPDMNVNMVAALKRLGWAIPEKGSKFYRAQPLAIAAEAGNVWLAPGEWNDEFIREASQFKDQDSDKVRKDDQVDAVCLAYGQLKKWG
jgi:predicted phage terminase large subunit-like protein